MVGVGVVWMDGQVSLWCMCTTVPNLPNVRYLDMMDTKITITYLCTPHIAWLLSIC